MSLTPVDDFGELLDRVEALERREARSRKMSKVIGILFGGVNPFDLSVESLGEMTEDTVSVQDAYKRRCTFCACNFVTKHIGACQSMRQYYVINGHCNICVLCVDAVKREAIYDRVVAVRNRRWWG